MPAVVTMCTLCTPVPGGWSTRSLVTKETCEGLGGSWSPPAGYTTETAPPGSVGPCGAPLNLPCDQYYAYGENNPDKVLMTPWIPVGDVPGTPVFDSAGHLIRVDGGSVSNLFMNACYPTQIGILQNGSIDVVFYSNTEGPTFIGFNDHIPPSPRDTENYAQYVSRCIEFGQRYNLQFCVKSYNQPIPLDTDATTTITENAPTIVTTDYPGYGIPITIIGVGVGTALGYYFGTNGNPPPPPPPPTVVPNPVGNTSTLQEGARRGLLEMLRVIGVGAGRMVSIFGPILARPQILGNGDYASVETYIITVFSEDVLSADTYTVEILV